MKRRLVLAALALLACRERESAAPRQPRVVSLSPSITDTLFAIGAGHLLVARSDYCDYPEAARSLPRVGTSITPSYETITRLEPSLIVSEDNAAARKQELAALAPTLLLRWLTLAEVAAGIRALGKKVEKSERAEALAHELETRLGAPPPERAPRVLLVLGSDTGRLDELWFIRKNSLQGAALHAAGARNAVENDVAGQPRLSLEALVALDPDALIVFTASDKDGEAALAPYRKLTALRAVRDGRLGLVATPEAFANGPRVLDLIDKLEVALERIGVSR